VDIGQLVEATGGGNPRGVVSLAHRTPLVHRSGFGLAFAQRHIAEVVFGIRGYRRGGGCGVFGWGGEFGGFVGGIGMTASRVGWCVGLLF